MQKTGTTQKPTPMIRLPRSQKLSPSTASSRSEWKGDKVSFNNVPLQGSAKKEPMAKAERLVSVCAFFVMANARRAKRHVPLHTRCHQPTPNSLRNSITILSMPRILCEWRLGGREQTLISLHRHSSRLAQQFLTTPNMSLEVIR